MEYIFKKIGVGLGLCTALAPQICTAQKPADKPNILFVLLDDMGKEWSGFSGAEDIETPNIDLLAKQGVVFKNMYSMPQCIPSRVSLLTGQYPWNHGWVNHYDVPRWGHGVRFDPEQNKSFPEYLQEESYTTCAAGKWQINDFRIEPEILKEVGFDDYCMWTGYEANNIPSQKRYWDPYIHTKEGSRTYPGEYSEDIFSDFVIDFMTKHKGEPFMAYYAMCLPHGPLEPTPLETKVKNKTGKA
jgi:arylsulfatase A-like enzyme